MSFVTRFTFDEALVLVGAHRRDTCGARQGVAKVQGACDR